VLAGERFPATQNPYNLVGAAYYDEQAGTLLERCTDSGCGQNVGWIANGDSLGYYAVDFGATPPAQVVTRLASGSTATGTIEYRLDSTSGPLIASVPVSGTGGWQTWTSRTTTVTPGSTATGVHRLYLVFRSSGTADFVNLNWFQFAR